MITFSRIELRTPASFTLTLLALSVLAGCSGGSRKSEHSASATSARTSAFAVGNVLEDDISTGIFKLPSTSPTPSMPFTPTAPVPRPPVAADVDVTDVKIGVNDLGFDRNGIWNYPASYASQLRGIIAAGEAERGAHGSAVTRLMAGRDIGDEFPVGAASSAELYIAHVPRFPTPARMQHNLEQFAANGVKIINNSCSIRQKIVRPGGRDTWAAFAEPTACLGGSRVHVGGLRSLPLWQRYQFELLGCVCWCARCAVRV